MTCLKRLNGLRGQAGPQTHVRASVDSVSFSCGPKADLGTCWLQMSRLRAFIALSSMKRRR
jgi:hypothetical protein